MNCFRCFALIVLLPIPAFVIKGMDGGVLGKALQEIGSQQLAKEATKLVWETDHPMLEETLVPKIENIVSCICSNASFEQKAVDIMQRHALEVLMRKYNNDPVPLNEVNVALVIRFVNHLLLVDVAHKEDFIAKLKQTGYKRLPVAGMLGVMAGWFLCKFVCGC